MPEVERSQQAKKLPDP